MRSFGFGVRVWNSELNKLLTFSLLNPYTLKNTDTDFNPFYHLFVSLDDLKFESMKQLKHLLERSAFGVCTYLGEKMGIASATVRLYFIYISFVTLGSPLIFYLFVAFWLNIRSYLKSGKKLLWG